ncbi:MAG: hypothetical protein QXU13_06615 [Desulfurococcaceae archaeon]
MIIENSAKTSDYASMPIEELSLLVDDLLVKQVVLAGFRDGIIGHWPPELDDEVEYIANRLYAPNKPLTYMVINGELFKYKYMVLLLGERFILLAMDKRVNAEEVGERLIELLGKLGMRGLE